MNLKHSGSNRVYRATKIWNECVYLFQKGMPVKRHRYHVRNYPETFSGEEAANWLYGTLKLNSYFGQDITKTQVVQLLSKFFKCGVFEGIKPMKNFKAGKQLYRFKSTSYSETRHPLSVLSQSSVNNRVDLKTCERDVFEKEEMIVNKNNASYKENENILPADNNKNKPVESDSLKRLKIRLKSEMKKEYWKREDLKTDFLMRLISEKIQENLNAKGNKSFYETTSFGISEISQDSSENAHSCSSIHDYRQDEIKSSSGLAQDFTESVLKLKSECLGDYLMKAIVKRLNSILGPHLSVNALIPYDSINPMWIIYNISTDMECFNNIGLPPWIIDAFACLGFFGDQISKEEEKYPGYYVDVYHVLCESMVVLCSGPLIPVELKQLIIGTFQFLENLNRSENGSKIVTSSTEDLLTDMLSSPSESCKNNGFDNPGFSSPEQKSIEDQKELDIDTAPSVGFFKQGLFTDCCYETAFTSDVPITRIILNQKSHIRRTRSISSLKEVNPNNFETPAMKQTTKTWIKHCRRKEKLINYPFVERNLDLKLTKDSNECRYERSGNYNLRRSNSISTSGSLDQHNLRLTAPKCFIKRPVAYKENKYNCYVNYGMSVDCTENDCDVNKRDDTPHDINYAEAIENVYRLVQHSRLMMNKVQESAEEATFVDLNGNRFSGCYETVEKIDWLPFVEYLGLTLFRNELLFLHPENRIRLNVILFLIDYGNKEVEIKNELLMKLSCCILCCSKEDGISDDKEMALIIQFLAAHRQEIMRYVDDHILNIRQSNQVCDVGLDSMPTQVMSARSREFTSKPESGVLERLKNLRI